MTQFNPYLLIITFIFMFIAAYLIIFRWGKK
jgi:hypothetical protein